nr:hypothetical protein [Tanacetum cinerariifolium]
MPKVLSRDWEKFFEIQHAQLEDTNELHQKLLEDLEIISEELAEYINSLSWNHPTFYNNDKEHSIQYKECLENSSNAITTVLPTKEPEYSLSMGYEHLSTIPKTKSDEVIKSSVKNLVQISSEYEVTSDNEKDVPMENFKIYSNPLFDDEEINSNKIDLHYFNAESNLIESLSNRDTLFDSSPKFDYLEEFSGELVPTSIINEERIKREHEEYISLMEKLLTINSFSRLLENFHANTIIETLPTSSNPGIPEHYVLMPNILPTLPTFDPLYPVYDTLLPFSLENEDKVFKPGILSYLLLSHRDKTTFDFSENPMMMYGRDIPLLVVLDLHTIPMDK